MSIYLILLTLSISFPLVLSFDKKLQFYKKWKYVLPAITVVALVYISFDIWLTAQGVWGFNHQYHSNIVLWGLPLEEWLFFFIIPYASLFLHYSFVLYFPKIKLSNRITTSISLLLTVILFVVIVINPQLQYTTYIYSFTILALGISLNWNHHLLNSFYITFLIILVPFVVINSILTGSFIPDEVVWYNNAENLGIRFLTIPIEDFAYAFSMLLFSLQIISYLEFKSETK